MYGKILDIVNYLITLFSKSEPKLYVCFSLADIKNQFAELIHGQKSIISYLRNWKVFSTIIGHSQVVKLCCHLACKNYAMK